MRLSPIPASADLLRKYGDARVPRYTSYPTAPHFGPAVDEARYRAWLGEVAVDSLSLYVHVPFCERLCWYCGCHMQVARNYGPVREYVRVLGLEIERVAGAMNARPPVRHLHWGGGSPNRIGAEDFSGLMRSLRGRFAFAPDAEVAIEIDPRTVHDDQIAAYGESGVTRASLGLQDFTPEVQKAINRIQSFEQVAHVAERLRAAGVAGLNFDLMYGLPHQGVDEALRSVDLALSLAPDRFAVFGYAHVPWMKKHQELIETAALPDANVRRASAERIAERLTGAGYVQIGLDHYARPDDPMALALAAGELRRNFQGYTTDESEVLIGLGASAIGSLPQGYVQNEADIRKYEERVRRGELAAVRGIPVSEEDRLRRGIIERLMCDNRLDLDRVCSEHGADPERFAAELAALDDMARDGILVRDGNRIEITAVGQPYSRTVAAVFDAYLNRTQGRHSLAV